MLTENNAERISTSDIRKCLGDSIYRVALIIVVEELCNGFGVRFALEAVAFGDEEGFQLTVIFDDAVMNNGNSAVSDRVRVDIGRFAVSCPTGMADAARSDRFSLGFKLCH